MMMLMGVVNRNAVMMIDFTPGRQRGSENFAPEQAIYEAALQ